MAHESRLSDFSDTTAFKAKIKPEGTNIFKINRQRFDKPSWKDTAIMSASAKAAFNHAIEVEKHPAYWKAVRRSPKQVAERIQVLEDYSLKALLGIFV
jgi:TPP-dependent trihydroxycyclohexane-1,2-dione (THcHDO) dehydratase